MRAVPLLLVPLLLAAPLSAQAKADGLPDRIEAALIALARRADPEVQLGPMRAALSVYELELGEVLKGKAAGAPTVDAIRRYFFETLRYEVSTDLADPANFYLDRVLAKRQGYCLSLSALILAVARRLDLPIRGVAAPRHFFLCYEVDGKRFNIETTQKGRVRSDAYYRAHGVTEKAEADGVYLRSLTDSEVVAQLLNNEGFIHWQAGRIELAATRWRQALARHPRLAEASLNLGIHAASSGKAEESRRLFARVLAWMPADVPTLLNGAVAALLDGRPADALRGLDEARRAGGGRREIEPIRGMILGALFQPRNWKRHQETIDRDARKAKLVPGLRGRYHAGRNFERLVGERIDPRIDFEWRWNRPWSRVPADDFSIRWDGYVLVPSDGFHAFALVYNDGVRLWVDGVLLIDDWKRNEGGLKQEVLELKKGYHRLRLEYFEHTRFAGVTLEVKRSDSARALGARSFWHRAR